MLQRRDSKRLSRDNLPFRNLGERKLVTVCVAALFSSDLTAPHVKSAIVLTDRMITAGVTQYEPSQMKVSFITDHTSLVIAGDYSLHSQALKKTIEHVRSFNN